MKKYLPLTLLAILLSIGVKSDSQIIPEGVGGVILEELPDGWQYEFEEVIIKGEIRWVIIRDRLNWFELQWQELAGAGFMGIIGGIFLLIRFYVQVKELRKGEKKEIGERDNRKQERLQEQAQHLKLRTRVVELETENKILKSQTLCPLAQ